MIIKYDLFNNHYMNKQTPKYTCVTCTRKYISKYYFDRHIICCKNNFICDKERSINNEEISDTPSVRDLYVLIKDLTVKTNSMQNKINELTTYINNKKKRLNAMEWLSMYCKPSQSFTLWLNSISITRLHLELIFNNGFIIGISLILQEYFQSKIENDTNIPIQALSLKKNVIYYYSETDSSWNLMQNKELENMVNNIKKKLICEFNLWQNENSHRMQDDNFSKIYHQNIIKLLACNIDSTIILSKIRSRLYSQIYRIVYIEP